MKLYSKTDNLHKKISFNIFAFNGYVILSSIIYGIAEYNRYSGLYGHGSWEAAFGWLIVWMFNLCLIPLVLAFIIFLIELAFDIHIKSDFWVNNKILKHIRYTGFIISIVCILYMLTIIM